jgi:hypothetical protein
MGECSKKLMREKELGITKRKRKKIDGERE